jgi:uncharacterized protein (DUF1800 family)
MKRLMPTAAAIALAAAIIPSSGNATGPFDKKLTPDQQIVHSLNRLAFGPRPGDMENVRRVGVNKWIELQLHPEQIPENPVLEEKLKPLETLRMDLAAVMKEYAPPEQPAAMMAQVIRPLPDLLPQDQLRKVRTGTAEERVQVLNSLDPDKRKDLLATLPENVLEFTPGFKEEAVQARRERSEQMAKQLRRLNPQLPDLLDRDQMRIAMTGTREQLLAVLTALDADKRRQVVSVLPPRSLAVLPEYRRDGQRRREPRQVASEDLKEARVLRAVYSNRQLEEVLVDFWINHFNVDMTKNMAPRPNMQNLGHVLIGSYERDAIRPHVLGHFRDLLLATARHPAMLYYLDNWQSMAPGNVDVGPFAPQRGNMNGVPNTILPGPLDRIAHGLNENYGREVMELHTLGVKGGYTQDDVIAVARCFTGWTVRSPENPEFVFAPFMHDFGEKTVLGHRIAAGGGESDGLAVIDILARHPSAAKFISRELARRFVADDPPQALVDRMAQTFTKTDGDLRAVMETMFKSPEFFSEGAWQAKFKSPLEMAVSTVRALGGEVTDAFTLVQKIADMGEPLYSKLEPTGYPDTAEPWLSTAGIMARISLPVELAAKQVPGITLNSARWKAMDAAAVARELLGHDASAQTIDAIAAGFKDRTPDPERVAALVLSSPDFERK